MSQAQPVRPKVLIVGAGPAGSRWRSTRPSFIPCLLVERNDRVGYAPRAKTTNIRTREHLRRWGIADNLKAASPLGADYPSNIVFCTRLAGFGLTRFENAVYCAPGSNPFYSEHSQWIPQYILEEVLRAHAQSLPGVEIRFNAELQASSRTRIRSRQACAILPTARSGASHASTWSARTARAARCARASARR